jgi:hypothetical protein
MISNAFNKCQLNKKHKNICITQNKSLHLQQICSKIVICSKKMNKNKILNIQMVRLQIGSTRLMSNQLGYISHNEQTKNGFASSRHIEI